MNLESVQAEIRQRHPWEAADLGVAMARREWKPLLSAWCMLAVPLAVLLTVFLHDSPWVMMTLFWWLKPLLSTMPLFSLSRRLFGVHPTRRELWQAAGSWLLRRGWLELTLFRLGPRRCLIGTIRLLEGMKSPAQRLNLFRALTPGNLVVAAHFVEMALWLALIMMGTWFVPDAWLPWHEGILGFREYASNGPPPGELDRFGLLVCAAYFVAGTVGELLYAAASFGAYLNVRTEVEGWDVEILFKRLTQRLNRAAGLVSALALLGVALAGLALPAGAADGRAADRNAEIAREVTADQDFTIHRGESFRAVEQEEKQELKEDTGTVSVSAPPVTASALSAGAWGVTIVLICAVVALLIWWIAKTNWSAGGPPRERNALRQVAGMDVTEESLPDDPLSVARRLYAAGDVREALSLLYRSALSWFVHQAGVPFRESDTEGDCLRRTADLPQNGYFRSLTRAWQDTAYASLPPPPDRWEALCAAWPFAAAPTTAPGKGSPKGPALAGAAALLACLLFTGCGEGMKRQKVEETYGYRGQARTNPFLALERYGEHTRQKVVSSFSLLKSLHGTDHRVLVMTPDVLQSRTHADQLIEAVGKGRHAIVSVTDLWDFEETGWQPTRVLEEDGQAKNEPLMLDRDTWDFYWKRHEEMERDKLQPEDEEEKARAPRNETPVMRNLRRRAPGLGQLLKEMEVEVSGEEGGNPFRERPMPVASETAPEAEPDVESEDETEGEEGDPEPTAAGLVYRLQEKADWGNTYTFQHRTWQGDEKSRVLTISYGYGSVTFVPSLRPFTNLRLAEGRHATLWNAMIDGHGTAAVIRGSDIGVWDLVKEQGWRPLIGCILALILWLWACQRRFGLRKRAEITELHSSAGALQASGEFLWTHGLTPEMITVWQDRIRSRWRLAGHAEAGFIPAAAAATGLPESLVAECLRPLGRLRPRQFTELARRLHQIESAI